MNLPLTNKRKYLKQAGEYFLKKQKEDLLSLSMPISENNDDSFPGSYDYICLKNIDFIFSEEKLESSDQGKYVTAGKWHPVSAKGPEHARSNEQSSRLNHGARLPVYDTEIVLLSSHAIFCRR